MCVGTQTGGQYTYDNEGRLLHWQNAPTSPTSTAEFAYDGEGNRVGMQSTSGGPTSTTYYLLGGLEEVTNNVLAKYEPVPGVITAVNVRGTLSYLASDGLGSVSVALNTTGSATAEQLFASYGTVRYSNGTMPTARGFTGQYADAATGLQYFNTRYYDPTIGQFGSADTTLAGGLDRYGYVGGNPTTRTDPSGHDEMDPYDRGGGDAGSEMGAEAHPPAGGSGRQATRAWAPSPIRSCLRPRPMGRRWTSTKRVTRPL